MNYEVLSQILWAGSITLLVSGIFAILIKRCSKKTIFLLAYIVTILLMEGISYYYSDYHNERLNIFLFHFSGFLHFFFVTQWYHNYFEKNKQIKNIVITSIGLLLLIGNLSTYDGASNFQIYGNVLYNLAIISFSLSYFITIVIKGIKPKSFELFFNFTVLLYFSFDAVISLTSNFLVNEHLSLVAPFWLLRTLLLQLFYVSLINFSWQLGKTRK